MSGWLVDVVREHLRRQPSLPGEPIFANEVGAPDHDDGDDGDDRPLGMRVAACALLLYAQPVTRIMTLTGNDFVVDDDGMTLTLGDPPAPVPEPFAALVRRLLAQRPPTPAAGCSPAVGPASR